MKQESILEELSEVCGCFISSLKNPEQMQLTLKNLLKIDFERYSVDEWNYCISYLFNEETCLKNKQEVQSFLQRYIKN